MAFRLQILNAIVLLGLTAQSNAIPLTFTDRSLFDIEVAMSIGSDVRTVNFDGLPADQALPVGSSLATSGGTAQSNITLEYVIGDGSGGTLPAAMQVSNVFDTTSGDNYLGIDDAGNFDQFVAGQVFNLNIGDPINALGMYFITGDPLLAGDIFLSTAVGDVVTDGVVESVLDDGGLVYFLGLVSSDFSFGDAFIRFGAGVEGAFLYNVDDIVIAKVSAPSTALLTMAGLLGLFMRKGKLT